MFDPPNQFQPLQIFNCLPLISEQSVKSLNLAGDVFGQQNQNIQDPCLTSELPKPVSETKINIADFKKIHAEVRLIESHEQNQQHDDTSNDEYLLQEPPKVCVVIILFALLDFAIKYGRSIIQLQNSCFMMRETVQAMFGTSKALPCTTVEPCCRHIQQDSTGSQVKYKPQKQSTCHFYKLAKTHQKDQRSSAPFLRYVFLLIMFLVMHTNAQTCFNDKLPSFIMDIDLSNEYVWQTVIITKDDRYLYKGGYVKISQSTQTAFPGAPVGTHAIAGLFDSLTNTFIWVKLFQDENVSSPIISAMALNNNEDTLVLAGTSTNAKQSFYFFVDPKTGAYKYPSFTVLHEQDFHLLTSQSILLAGSSRLYCTGISMAFTETATNRFTNECSNIGQACSGTTNVFPSLDAIQYLVVDYATQTVVWHKIANSGAHFGAGSVASLIDVNPTASVNGQEHVIMGGGFSTDTSTYWKASLMSINPLTGQLDLVQGLLSTITSTNTNWKAPTESNYPIIVHMNLYQTATKWSIYILTQSRLLSTNGAAGQKRHLCQINFSSATYTTVTATICRDASTSSTSQRKSHGTGIKYDPSNNQVHFFNHDSNLATSNGSGDNYLKVYLDTGKGEENVIFNTFISNAGVFINKSLVTLSVPFQVFPGYFVGYQKSFAPTNFLTAPGALTFTKNSAVTYPFDRAETCSAEKFGGIKTTLYYPILTCTISTQTNLVVGKQSNQVLHQRLYKSIDIQFNSLVKDNLCGTSSYTPLTVIPGSFHNVNLYIGSSTLYQCPFTLNSLNSSCTDTNVQIYSIDESSITGTKTNIFTADGLNSQILIQILDKAVLPQSQTIKVTSTTPSGVYGSFNYIANLRCGPAPVGFNPCRDISSMPTCLTAIDSISILKSTAPLNVTYELGSEINCNATVLPFSLSASCTYCTTNDIVYSMIVTPLTAGQNTSFIKFDLSNMVIDWTNSNSINGGEFEITIQGLIDRADQVFDTFTFKISVISPCLTTSWYEESLVLNATSLRYSSNQAPVLISIMTVIKDSVSEKHGNSDGQPYCGPRTAHLFDQSTGQEIDTSGSSGITLIGDSLILFNLTKEGNYTFNLSYSLDNYTQIPFSSKQIFLQISPALKNETQGEKSDVNSNTTKSQNSNEQIQYIPPTQEEIIIKKLLVPVAKILSIDRRGLVTLEWNISLRLLLKDQQPNLIIKLLPGSRKSDTIHLNVSSFNITSFDGKRMKIQIKFQSPNQISKYDPLDILTIEFVNKSQFLSYENVQTNQSFVQLNCPKQFAEKSVIFDVKNAIDSVLLILILSFIASNPFTLQLVNFILNSAATLTLMTHLILINLSLPENVIEFGGQLFPIVNFDVLPTDTVYQFMFKLSEIEDQPRSDQFNQVGYTGQLAINNMGSLFIFIILQPILILILKFVRLLTKDEVNCLCKLINEFADSRLKQLQWNGILCFYYENYMVLSMFGWISLNDLRFGSKFNASENFTSVFGVILFLFSLIYPIIFLLLFMNKFKPFIDINQQIEVIYQMNDQQFEEFVLKHGSIDNFLSKYHTTNQREKFYEEYGALLQDLDVRRIGIRSAVYIKLAYLAVQFLIIISVTYLSVVPVLSIFACMYTILLYIGYLIQVKPFKENWQYFIEIINMTTILYLTYLLIIFTDFVDIQFQVEGGNQYIYAVLTNIGLNFILTAYPSCLQTIMCSKRCKKKYLFDKEQKARKKRLQNQFLLQASQEKKQQAIQLINSFISQDRSAQMNANQIRKMKQIAKPVELSQPSELSEIAEESQQIDSSEQNIVLSEIEQLDSQISEMSFRNVNYLVSDRPQKSILKHFSKQEQLAKERLSLETYRILKKSIFCAYIIENRTTKVSFESNQSCYTLDKFEKVKHAIYYRRSNLLGKYDDYLEDPFVFPKPQIPESPLYDPQIWIKIKDEIIDQWPQDKVVEFYLNYLDTRYIIMKCDDPPRFRGQKDKRCEDYYSYKVSDLQQKNENASQLRQQFISFQQNENRKDL